MIRSIALAFTMALLLAVPAEARFSAPDDVSGGPADYGWTLASNARGDRALVWQRGSIVRLSYARAGHRFGPPRTIPGSRNEELLGLRAAMSPAGDVLVTWTYFDNFRPIDEEELRDEGCCYGDKAVVYTAAGRFGPRVALAPRGMTTSIGGLAIASASRFAVVFSAADESLANQGVFVRASSGRARFGPLETLASQETEVFDLSLVRGRARMLYRPTPNSTRIAETTRAGRGRYSTPRSVFAGLGDGVGPPPFFTDRRGGQFGVSGEFAWFRRSGGVFRRQHYANLPYESYGPSAHAAPNGAAAVAWSQGTTLRLAMRRPGGRVGRPRVVWRGPRGSEPLLPQVAVDSAGRTAIVVQVVERGERRYLLVATVAPGASRAVVQRLEHGAEYGASRDDRGRATVWWVGARSRLRAAYGP